MDHHSTTFDGTESNNNVDTVVIQLLDDICNQICNHHDGDTLSAGTITELDQKCNTTDTIILVDGQHGTSDHSEPDITEKQGCDRETIQEINRDFISTKTCSIVQEVAETNSKIDSENSCLPSAKDETLFKTEKKERISENGEVVGKVRKNKLISSEYEDSSDSDKECDDKILVDDKMITVIQNYGLAEDEEVDVLSYVTSVVQEDFEFLKKLSLVENDLELFPTLANGRAKTDLSDSSGSSSSEDSESSTSSSSTDFSSSDESEPERKNEPALKVNEVIKVISPRNKILSMGLLPPVLVDIKPDKDLVIKPLGEIEVFHMSAPLVVIKSSPNVKPIDIESVLFLDDHSVLGQVMELIGKVDNPYYCVGFDSDEEIKNKNLVLGQKVYYAPENEEFTKFVFVKNTKSMRGSDASWKCDQELPDECEAFSDDDDEKEREAKETKKQSVCRENNKSNNSDQCVVPSSHTNSSCGTWQYTGPQYSGSVHQPVRMQSFHSGCGVRPVQNHGPYNPMHQQPGRPPLRNQYNGPPQNVYGEQPSHQPHNYRFPPPSHLYYHPPSNYSASMANDQQLTQNSYQCSPPINDQHASPHLWQPPPWQPPNIHQYPPPHMQPPNNHMHLQPTSVNVQQPLPHNNQHGPPQQHHQPRPPIYQHPPVSDQHLPAPNNYHQPTTPVRYQHPPASDQHLPTPVHYNQPPPPLSYQHPPTRNSYYQQPPPPPNHQHEPVTTVSDQHLPTPTSNHQPPPSSYHQSPISTGSNQCPPISYHQPSNYQPVSTVSNQHLPAPTSYQQQPPNYQDPCNYQYQPPPMDGQYQPPPHYYQYSEPPHLQQLAFIPPPPPPPPEPKTNQNE